MPKPWCLGSLPSFSLSTMNTQSLSSPARVLAARRDPSQTEILVCLLVKHGGGGPIFSDLPSPSPVNLALIPTFSCHDPTLLEHVRALSGLIFFRLCPAHRWVPTHSSDRCGRHILCSRVEATAVPVPAHTVLHSLSPPLSGHQGHVSASIRLSSG